MRPGTRSDDHEILQALHIFPDAAGNGNWEKGWRAEDMRYDMNHLGCEVSVCTEQVRTKLC